MKDATGELSMTAVAVVAIAAISTVFMTLIWPSIKSNILRSSYCSQAFSCSDANASNGMKTCYYCDGDDSTNCTSTIKIDCPDKE